MKIETQTKLREVGPKASLMYRTLCRMEVERLLPSGRGFTIREWCKTVHHGEDVQTHGDYLAICSLYDAGLVEYFGVYGFDDDETEFHTVD